ncbi:dihydropteroate synthase [Corynebacterium sp. TAE3-ERU12]|uniref:dihydropteroate synthase n=1 Tax=Corynebacterium sp. TAE3-ERU12 TaxID=2849491 RepID=UPI001C48261E|nr:dihydropteroate synthase [Corynebacterium sp. TAE3-ERU12]MBV7295054.1 dihydropteroate synthase [Corynebacterium sp. TAE3-ERU12]
MAIINRTPDSFYDRGATASFDAAMRRIDDVVAAGADVLDIGGVKAGPGPVVAAAEEIDRVVPTIAEAKKQHPEVFISVDTWRADVADAAIRAGADLVNDTWSGHDPELVAVAGQHRVGYVCSHTGDVQPRTRPLRVHYRDIVDAVRRDTYRLAEKAEAAGVPAEKILIDPTHDFGKNTHHGLELLRRLAELTEGDYPVLMALSNKDFIGETLGRDVDNRVAGTLAATAWSSLCGVAMLRVHEVTETIDTCRMIAAITGEVAPLSTVRGLQ